jgi:hypothetical protein
MRSSLAPCGNLLVDFGFNRTSESYDSSVVPAQNFSCRTSDEVREKFRTAAPEHDSEKLALGLDPRVGPGFPKGMPSGLTRGIILKQKDGAG